MLFEIQWLLPNEVGNSVNLCISKWTTYRRINTELVHAQKIKWFYFYMFTNWLPRYFCAFASISDCTVHLFKPIRGLHSNIDQHTAQQHQYLLFLLWLHAINSMEKPYIDILQIDKRDLRCYDITHAISSIAGAPYKRFHHSCMVCLSVSAKSNCKILIT